MAQLKQNPGYWRTENTRGKSLPNAAVHLSAIETLYYGQYQISNSWGTVTGERIKKAEKFFTDLGFDEVKIFHNPKDVTAIAYRDPKTNMMMVSFLGTDSPGDGKSIGDKILASCTEVGGHVDNGACVSPSVTSAKPRPVPDRQAVGVGM